MSRWFHRAILFITLYFACVCIWQSSAFADVLYEDTNDVSIAYAVGVYLAKDLGPPINVRDATMRFENPYVYWPAHGSPDICGTKDVNGVAATLVNHGLKKTSLTAVYLAVCSLGQAKFLNEVAKTLKLVGYSEFTLIAPRRSVFTAPEAPAPLYTGVFDKDDRRCYDLWQRYIRNKNPEVLVAEMNHLLEIKEKEYAGDYVGWAIRVAQSQLLTNYNNGLYKYMSDQECLLKPSNYQVTVKK